MEVEHAKCRAYTACRNDLSAERERKTTSWEKRHQHRKNGLLAADGHKPGCGVWLRLRRDNTAFTSN